MEQNGKVAGVFLSTQDGQVPLDLRRQLFAAATEKLRKQREELGITEEQIEADIDELHRKRRAARSGR